MDPDDREEAGPAEGLLSRRNRAGCLTIPIPTPICETLPTFPGEAEADSRACLPIRDGTDAHDRRLAAVVVGVGRRAAVAERDARACLLYTSPSPRDRG